MLRPNSDPCSTPKKYPPTLLTSFDVEARLAALLMATTSVLGCSATPDRKQPSTTGDAGAGFSESATVDASQGGEATTRGEPAISASQEAATLRSIVKQLTERLQQMETKLTAINDKVDATRSGVETLALEKSGKSGNAFPIPSTQSVYPNPIDAARSAGEPIRGVHPSSSVNNPAKVSSAAFINDGPVSVYRQALLLLETGKTKESIEAFGRFIDAHPDHVLAGSAQFHLGEAHFRIGDYSSAQKELQRVLTTYDRSTFVPETLKLLVFSSEQLKDVAGSIQHRQTLLSRYPQSPAAKEFMNARTSSSVTQRQDLQNAPPSHSNSFDAEAVQSSQAEKLDSPPESSSSSNSIPTAPSPLESKDSHKNTQGDTTGH